MMFKYFRDRKKRQEIEYELADLRIVLDSIMTLIFSEDLDQRWLNCAEVGSEIRSLLECRFSWAHEVHISSDRDLRKEEKSIDNLDATQLKMITDQLDKKAQSATAAECIEDSYEVIAVRLLCGWLQTKRLQKIHADPKILDTAREHEELHLQHIRNMLRIERGEQPV